MRRIFLAVFVGSLVLNVPVSTRADGSLAGEYQFEETYFGDGSVERNERKRVADFDENDTLVRVILTPRVKFGILRLGVEYERYSFGFGKNAPLPERLHSLSAVVGLDTQLSDSILVRAEAQPGVYGQTLRGNNFNVPFVIGGTYIYNPNLQFVLGVGVDVERRYPVLPGGGIRWKLASSWVINAVLPTPRLEYEVNRNLTAYFGGNFKETTYRMDEGFASAHGRLRGALLTYSEVRVGAGVDWKVADWVSVNLEGGYQPYRTFDFHRADIRYHEDGGAPYGMLALHGTF